MKIEIIKYFVKDGVEYGYYLVNGSIVVQNGKDYKVIPHFLGRTVKDSISDVTEKTKDEIRRVLKAGEQE